ncbi:MAG: sporulation protein YqfD, partial [Oscillospiraceae bacterium]|nr:sporulation protein YqfD [Oscillospiraceae bacterium]
MNAGAPCDMAAMKTGVVVSVDDFAGRGLVEPGDTVLRGQKLISGEVVGLSGEPRFVHSYGSVRARTWYVLSACAPLEYGAKIYTGAE